MAITKERAKEIKKNIDTKVNDMIQWVNFNYPNDANLKNAPEYATYLTYEELVYLKNLLDKGVEK